MAFLGIRVPKEQGRLFSDIEAPGEPVKAATYHITVLYIGDNVSIDELAEALKATYKVTSTTKPFLVRTSRVSCFPRNDHGVPIIARIESDPLHDLRDKLIEAFDEAGIEYNKNFPAYKPHVTLAWAEEELDDEERIPSTIEWGCAELILWGGDDGDRRLSMNFPFSLKEPKEDQPPEEGSEESSK